MKKVLVLGCTGSIGTSTLDIIRSENERFSVCGLTANSKKEALEKLSAEFHAPFFLTSEDGSDGIKKLIDNTKPDIIVNGIAGSAGLMPTILALESGIDLALANKESVVMAGPLIFKLAEKHNCRILPVDSEHSAIFTLIKQCGKENIDSVIITASGGPFRTFNSEKLKTVTVADALKHPTWNMGVKITIDSATLGNKGLEVIEAKRLFNLSADQIKVVVHPQSIIHSLVRTKDGIVYGQFSEPDMKHPILQALDWPKINRNSMRPFDLTDSLFTNNECKRTLTFEKPRTDDFPMLKLAYDAARNDNCYPIAFNAANEIAVQSFIDGKIGFTQIPETVSSVLEKDWSKEIYDLKDIFETDSLARDYARSFLPK
ncbi:1-deoxy-D-xylulose-5-phosphate reductoisomerase [Treponema zioleckii]|uniref:1-deoxy-D-xylulose-5-phosphate reductoisomerase n=1 Tax=Treponema zioleckii TaxID=331680 RepID=UPI00168AC339|nr:1-deoxy-D-xylulose-5-phosphate reductoisomerase [Treponema zioleckii]